MLEILCNWTWAKELELTLVAVPIMYCVAALVAGSLIYAALVERVMYAARFREAKRRIYAEIWTGKRAEWDIRRTLRARIMARRHHMNS